MNDAWAKKLEDQMLINMKLSKQLEELASEGTHTRRHQPNPGRRGKPIVKDAANTTMRADHQIRYETNYEKAVEDARTFKRGEKVRILGSSRLPCRHGDYENGQGKGR